MRVRASTASSRAAGSRRGPRREDLRPGPARHHDAPLHGIGERRGGLAPLVDDLHPGLDDRGVRVQLVRTKHHLHVVREQDVIAPGDDNDVLRRAQRASAEARGDPLVRLVAHIRDPRVIELGEEPGNLVARIRVVQHGELPVPAALREDAADRLDEQRRVAPERDEDIESHGRRRLSENGDGQTLQAVRAQPRRGHGRTTRCRHRTTATTRRPRRRSGLGRKWA